MDKIAEYKELILRQKLNIIEELELISNKYDDFFNIEKNFVSASDGKTRINRQIFNENHDFIIERVKVIKNYLNESNELIKKSFKILYEKYGQRNKLDTTSLLFDDINFLELLQLDIETKDVSLKIKSDFLNQIKDVIKLKNRISNFLFYIEMIDTTIFNKIINNLGVSELVNSVEIFEIINAYGLQLDMLHKFKSQLNNFEAKKTKTKDLYFLDSLFELYKKRAINFNYGGTSYKILLEYNNEIQIKKVKSINIAYLEHIVSSLIEQSCMDLVKKEIKKGKIQKFIEIDVIKTKKGIEISIKNNGFEVKNIYNMYLSDINNKYILDAKNLSLEIGATFDIVSNTEGMEYKISI